MRDSLIAAGKNPEFAKYMATQFALESGFGSNTHSRLHHNHGSVHARTGSTNTYLSSDKSRSTGKSSPVYFENFNSDREFADFFISSFLQLPRYRHILDSDPSKYFELITKAGYVGNYNDPNNHADDY